MSGPTDAPLLSVRNIVTGYGDLRVVWDVSFEVRAGEITVLLGRNGAGKTTTLRAVAGLNRLMGGTIEMNGEAVSKVSPHQRVKLGMAYVQEGKRVFRAQTIEQNLLLGAYSRRKRRSALQPDLDRVYGMFPILAQKRRDPASSMSGGQQQMLAIGQALMSAPTLLLLDEPSGGLAPAIVNEVMGRVRELTASGIGVVVVEQAVEASFAIADHVVILDMGRTVVSERAADIDDVSILHEAYFGRRAAEPSAG